MELSFHFREGRQRKYSTINSCFKIQFFHLHPSSSPLYSSYLFLLVVATTKEGGGGVGRGTGTTLILAVSSGCPSCCAVRLHSVTIVTARSLALSEETIRANHGCETAAFRKSCCLYNSLRANLILIRD